MKKSIVSLSVPALTAGVMAVAPAQAGPYGWRDSGPGHYDHVDKQVDRATVEKRGQGHADRRHQGRGPRPAATANAIWARLFTPSLHMMCRRWLRTV